MENWCNSDEISRPAANKVIKIKKNNLEYIISKKYYNYSKSYTYFLFKQQYPDIIISKSCFFTYLKKQCPHIKICRKATDLCVICQEGKTNKLKLNKLTDQDKNYNLLLEKIKLVEEHQSYNNHQKNEFKKQKTI